MMAPTRRPRARQGVISTTSATRTGTSLSTTRACTATPPCLRPRGRTTTGRLAATGCSAPRTTCARAGLAGARRGIARTAWTCTGEETCDEDGDTCVAGTTTCGDFSYCDVATDTCTTTCTNGCVIDGACYGAGQVNPLNPCQVVRSVRRRRRGGHGLGRQRRRALRRRDLLQRGRPRARRARASPPATRARAGRTAWRTRISAARRVWRCTARSATRRGTWLRSMTAGTRYRWRTA